MKTFWRWIRWPLAALALLVLSWLAFNGPWADAAPKPRPQALTPAPLQVGEPSAYALLRDKSVKVGFPTAAPLQCGTSGSDCTQVWLDQGGALREQLKSAGDFARVCEAATAEGVSWVEPALKLPERNPAAVLFPDFKNITSCFLWLRAQAVLAVLDGKDAQALQFLLRADRSVRGELDGAQTLIGHAIAWSMARRQFQTVAVLAGARPQLAVQLQELLRPLSPAALTTQRWLASESAFTQAITRDLPRSCEYMRDVPPESRGWFDRFWCVGQLGLLPELTAQQMDAVYLQLAERTHEGAVQGAVHRPKEVVETSAWAWRNSIGQVLLVAAQPQWGQYIDRQAEVELSRQAAELVVRMAIEKVPAAQRQAWLQAQALPPETKDRFSLKPDQLVAKPWRDDADAARQLTFQLPPSP